MFRRLEIAKILFRDIENLSFNQKGVELFNIGQKYNDNYLKLFLSLYLLSGTYFGTAFQPIVEIEKIIALDPNFLESLKKALELILKYKNKQSNENKNELLKNPLILAMICYNKQGAGAEISYKLISKDFELSDIELLWGSPLLNLKAAFMRCARVKLSLQTSRIVSAAQNRPVLEFGARRAHGSAAAIKGTRAAFIAGASNTSCTLAAKLYGLNANGTMAHSFVQIFDCFKGLENAILAFKKCGIKECSVRIDSGNLELLSKKIRARLDKAGLKKCKIIASNSLDEFVIKSLLKKGAPIDAFGVGEHLITAASEPIFSGVYKLVATKKIIK